MQHNVGRSQPYVFWNSFYVIISPKRLSQKREGHLSILLQMCSQWVRCMTGTAVETMWNRWKLRKRTVADSYFPSRSVGTISLMPPGSDWLVVPAVTEDVRAFIFFCDSASTPSSISSRKTILNYSWGTSPYTRVPLKRAPIGTFLELVYRIRRACDAR